MHYGASRSGEAAFQFQRPALSTNASNTDCVRMRHYPDTSAFRRQPWVTCPTCRLCDHVPSVNFARVIARRCGAVIVWRFRPLCCCSYE
jgi:hypothetical protein